MFSKRFLIIFLLVINSGCAVSEVNSPKIRTIGWVERVQIYPYNMQLDSKVDTGADTCSVHAEDIKIFKKKGQEYVSFLMVNRYGQSRAVERKVLRMTKIKTKDGGFQVRPVVNLGLCVDDYLEYVACNLVDRSNFDYPLLVGRNFLAGHFLVNSSETYKSEPNCDVDEK